MLLVVLLLCLAGCAQPTKEGTTAPLPGQTGSESRPDAPQLQAYERSVKAFTDACTAQIYAFTSSMDTDDIPAGRQAADTLKETLDRFQAIQPPERCASVHALFTQAWEKAGTIYALMLQILGDRQYDNDDMPYVTACEDAAEVFAQFTRDGLARLERLFE